MIIITVNTSAVGPQPIVDCPMVMCYCWLMVYLAKNLSRREERERGRETAGERRNGEGGRDGERERERERELSHLEATQSVIVSSKQKPNEAATGRLQYFTDFDADRTTRRLQGRRA